MDFLELLGFDFFGNNYLNDIPLGKRKSSSSKPQRRHSFIEEKRGYKCTGEKNNYPPSFDCCNEAQEIFKLIDSHLIRYYTLINLYSIVLCQISSSSFESEDESKNIVKQKMLNQRIYDLQTLGAEINEDKIVKASSNDMSIFLSLVYNLFSQEINRFNNDRDIYYYVKEDFIKKHDNFLENYLYKLKLY